MLIEIKAGWILIIFFGLCYIGKSQIGSDCKNDLECNKPYDYIKCAYCDKGKCAIINKMVFQSKLPCEYNKAHCQNSSCGEENVAKGLAQRYEGSGICVCCCSKSNLWGENCQEKGQFLATGVQVIMPQHLEFNQPTTMLLLVCQGPPPRLHVISEGYCLTNDIPSAVGHSWGQKECIQLARNDKYLDEDACGLVDWRSVETVYLVPVGIPLNLMTPPGQEIKSFTKGITIIAFGPGYQSSVFWQTYNYHLNYPVDDKFTTTPIVK